MSVRSISGAGARGPGSYLGLYCALMLTTCVASAGITVIYNDLPTLQRVFPGQPALAWVVTVYWLCSAVAAASPHAQSPGTEPRPTASTAIPPM